MKFREEDIGPFTREIGDFIAHPKRNRGDTLNRTAYMFSQIAFFQRYQGAGKIPLDFFGDCGWWLKPWFLGKIKAEPESTLKRISGLEVKELVKEVKAWFDGNEAYPTKLVCSNPDLFYRLASHFSNKVTGHAVFEASSARREVRQILKREGLPLSELEPVLVATAVLLQGKSAEIVNGFSARVGLSVHPQRSERVLGVEALPGANWHYAKVLPDGKLKIYVSTQNNTGDGLVAVGLDFLDTGIDTESYFCRSLVEVDEHGLPRLNLNEELVFERNAEKMVFRA